MGTNWENLKGASRDVFEAVKEYSNWVIINQLLLDSIERQRRINKNKMEQPQKDAEGYLDLTVEKQPKQQKQEVFTTGLEGLEMPGFETPFTDF